MSNITRKVAYSEQISEAPLVDEGGRDRGARRDEACVYTGEENYGCQVHRSLAYYQFLKITRQMKNF